MAISKNQKFWVLALFISVMFSAFQYFWSIQYFSDLDGSTIAYHFLAALILTCITNYFQFYYEEKTGKKILSSLKALNVIAFFFFLSYMLLSLIFSNFFIFGNSDYASIEQTQAILLFVFFPVKWIVIFSPVIVIVRFLTRNITDEPKVKVVA